MNDRNMRVGAAMFISTVCLLAVCAYAQDDPFGGASPPRHAESENSLLAAAPPPTIAAEDNQHCRCLDESGPAAEKIKRALHSQLSAPGIDYTETPLQEVLSDLQQRFAIPTHLDRVALEELGVSPDESVTVSLRNISLQAAVRLILKPLNLTYVIENEVLLVTTPDRAEAELMTCVYDVRDLAFTAPAPSKGSSPPAVNNRLAEVIMNCIAKETWSKNGGGEAELLPLGPDLLVISQTRPVHEKIQNLLSTIRKMKPDGESVARHEVPSSAKLPSAPVPATTFAE